ncbi:helix-turn-helix transcriptional regulator [Kribbella pittospori]|uniref:Helix-turn-helix transcriptional regulator n=1 Tax=Kribbella pittospori TaxID=722689 RepID=A0A4R0JRA3_9ACTN|nr:LuxR family transcriptional regulator [Kribbella pittospori]TCC48544.1 helix-turn-helix transcriptional regulator [Kribbella pittospori]
MGMADRELLGRSQENAVLDGLLKAARTGQSGVLVLCGEAGVGKSALLESLVGRSQAYQLVRAVGIESEMELAYAGLQQLCKPLLDRIDHLPRPQQEALGTAFGLADGAAPDRFLVGLAVLNLLSDAAGKVPVLCLIDDAQWLDRVSAQVLAFVARRLAAESVVLLFAVRHGEEHELSGLPELEIRGLNDADARALLDSVLPGPVDPRIRDRIVAETHGNPLALMELPRAWSVTELADGNPIGTLSGRIEESFVRRLEVLPPDTRLLLLTAAAEPLGDATLLWQAAEQLGLGADPAAGAIESGLITFGQRIQFRHPLVRSAAYRMASARDRQAVHHALADVTDPETSPDRRAWHRAQATAMPDEEVAAELESSARRAQSCGGLIAAADFLERSTELTPEPARRAERALAAAAAKRGSGALDAALHLLSGVAAGPRDPVRDAEVERLRGQIAFDQGHARDAARQLLSAARRLDPHDPVRARITYLEAMSAAIWASGPEAPGILAFAAAAAPPPVESDPPADLLLQSLALRFTQGYTTAAPHLTKALELASQVEIGTDDVASWLWLAGNRAAGIVAIEVWDFDTAEELALRQERMARESGALVQLQFALNFRANLQCLTGDLSAVAALVEEGRQLAAATGYPELRYGGLLLEAFRGNETTATPLIGETIRTETAHSQGRMAAFATYANAVLHNGLGRYDVARDAGLQVFEQDVVGYGALVIGEVAEAASRTGDTKLVETALAWLAERTAATPTEWGLGIEARIRALLTADEDAYRRSIEHLGRTRLAIEVARSQLLYGEWLRREGRRVDARDQLRTAHDQLSQMGFEAFAERARHELLATGETVRKRSPETLNDLTAQEAQIAGLARDGMTNPEIAAQLFISPRTVEWHLRKTFSKLGITSRRQLRGALASPA